MQEAHPIAYISKALAPKHQSLSVYEKELLAVVYAVKKWDHYVAHRHFLIKIDHRSLKFILEQRITTNHQQKYIAKLFGYDFGILYKKGEENTDADALSRLPAFEFGALTVIAPVCNLFPEIEQSWASDPNIQKLIESLKAGTSYQGPYTWHGTILRRKCRIVVGHDVQLKQKLLQLMHDSALGGHSRVQGTFKRLQLLFFWKGMERDVQNYVRNCVICQTCKPENVNTPSLLQPLPIPE